LAAVLFALFATALALTAGDGMAISCGCGIGSPALEVTGPGKVAQAVGLFVAANVLLFDSLRKPGAQA
jgi:hypothetical protein